MEGRKHIHVRIHVHFHTLTLTLTHIHIHVHTHIQMHIHTHTQIHVHVHVRLRVRVRGRGGGEGGEGNGVGWVGENVLFSTCSQTLNGFLSVNLSEVRDNSTWAVSWLAELTVTLPPVSLLSPPLPVCPSQKPPCVDWKRSPVYRHHARMW